MGGVMLGLLGFNLIGIIVLILSLTSLKISLHYRRQGSNDYLSLKLSLWRGLIFYKLEVPVVDTGLKHGSGRRRRPLLPGILRPSFKIEATIRDKNRPDPLKRIEEEKTTGLSRIFSMMIKGMWFYKNYSPVIRFFLGRVHLRSFQWITEFGMEEPHITGFLTGLAGGIKGLLISKLYRLIQTGAARPTVVITPRFHQPCFNTRINCEFEVKIGYIILAGLKFVILRKSLTKV